MQDERLQRSLGYALVRAFRSVNREANRALIPYGLSAEQAHILLVLWFEGPMKVGELQRMLALGSGTLTGALDRMQEQKLVVRVRDPEDKRAFRIEPGKIAPQKRAKIERTLIDFEEKSFSRLTKKEQRELLVLLGKLVIPKTARTNPRGTTINPHFLAKNADKHG